MQRFKVRRPSCWLPVEMDLYPQFRLKWWTRTLTVTRDAGYSILRMLGNIQRAKAISVLGKPPAILTPIFDNGIGRPEVREIYASFGIRP